MAAYYVCSMAGVSGQYWARTSSESDYMEATIDGRKGMSINWEGSAITRPRLVVKPERISELVDIVKNEKKYPAPVRAVGFQHSITRCAVADGGTIIDMRNFNRILECGQGHVRVQAGVRIYDLVKALDSRGLQLCACPEFGDISAGSVACTSNRYISSRGILGQISSTVVAMKLVTPQGTKLDVTAKQPDMLNIMRSSFGLLGIVYEVTFAVRDKIGFVVERRQIVVDQGVSVDQLDGAGGGQQFLARGTQGRACGEQQNRAKSLAARQHCVPHGDVQSGRRLALSGQEGVECLVDLLSESRQGRPYLFW